LSPHRQSDLVVMRVPSSFMNGSGSLELEVNEPGRVTGQSAPSSSPVAAAAAAAAVVVLITVTAPAMTSAAIVSMTTVERIAERPKLMITRALLLGVMGDSAAISDHGTSDVLKSFKRAPKHVNAKLEKLSALSSLFNDFYRLSSDNH
jgi:hypothetical protein